VVAAGTDTFLDRAGRFLARVLTSESTGYRPYTPSDPETLRATLQPCDVLLVEGNQHLSAAIKYLTQSTWSHAALYVGDRFTAASEAEKVLVEVTVEEGCVAVPLSKYRNHNTRICRPVGLTHSDRESLIDFMVGSIGLRYDLRNVVDLVRYLLPTPPVPVRWRRRMIAFGSGDPTRAICSTLIAEAFGRIRYPILPPVEEAPEPHATVPVSGYSRREIMHIRHHSLYTPRDFDLSPYFRVVKPTIERGFDYKDLVWMEAEAAPAANAGQGAG
jgi:hypothetical protein